MRQRILTLAIASALAAPAPLPAAAEAVPVAGTVPRSGPTVELHAPIFSDLFARVPVATVDGDPITMRDLGEALASSHGAHGTSSEARAEVGPLVDRLVTTRLLVAEAREMKLDELPEVKESLARFRETVLREMLKDEATREVKPDAMEVESLVREAVREYKLEAVLFATPEEARAFRAAIDGGRPFADVAAEVLSSKRGTSWDLPEHVRIEKMIPPVREAVAPLEPGGVTTPIALPQGQVVIRLADVRYPEDAKARARANAQSVARLQREALGRYYESLKRKHARVNEAVIERVNFDAVKPGIEALQKDRRAIARIAGARPVTVGDLARELRRLVFHGPEQGARPRIDRRKHDSFDNLLFRRLLDREAEVRKLAETTEYRRRLADEERGTLFGVFVEKAILPDIQVMESEVRSRYDANPGQLSSPLLYKLEALGFVSAAYARTALEKLQGGADLRWVKENAEGQLPARAASLVLDGVVIQASELPEGLEKDLHGAKSGDYRLHRTLDGQHYVVHVLKDFPPTPQPYLEAREALARKLYEEKVEAAVRDWSEKLRRARKVEVFITSIKV